jgi:phosphohistidine phosphatase
MKRTLVLIRHAKSSWATPLQADYDRPLNDRGNKDAPEMGRRLHKAGLVPDLIVCSTAVRTRETAKHIAGATGYDLNNVLWLDKLYHCAPTVFDDVLYELPDTARVVFIIAHNPGITEFANTLSRDFYTADMPTCGIVGSTAEVALWADFGAARKKVILFDYPKNDHDS